MTREEAVNYLQPIADSASLPRYAEALNMAISALKEQDVTDTNVGCKWISVEERLPEVNRLVLCYRYNASQYRIGFYIGAKYAEDVATFRSINELFAFGVTHWMPLPQPPKEDNHDGQT